MSGKVEYSESSNFHKTIQKAFSTAVSWTKASPSCRYRFEILGVGEFFPEFHITAHSHTFHEVGLVLKGTGELLVGGKRHSMNPGSLYVVHPGEAHRLSAQGVEGFFVFIFKVTAEPNNKGSKADILPGLHHSKVITHKSLLNHIFSWTVVNETRLIDPVALSLFGRYIAFEMLALLSHQSESENWSLVDRAKDFIRQSLPGKIEVGTIAVFLGVSERTLRRHFQQYLGKSVIDYVNEQRLRLAERFLTLHIGVADAAHLVGFESASQLSRLFHKVKGVAPKAWQQSVAPTKRMSKSKP